MMHKKRKAIIASNEISELKTFSLNGYSQKVLIEGKSKDLPVVLCLHGGPGTPIPFSVGCRGMFPELTDRYLMVYWDQLGCGINNYVIDNNFNIDMFVDMAIDLIKILKEKFPKNKLFLFAVSWGTILSAKAIQTVPELIDGAVVYGQILKELLFNKEVQDTLRQSNAPDKMKSKVEVVFSQDVHTVADIKFLSKTIQKYTNGYNNKTVKSAPVGDIILGLLRSPDYKIKDFIAVVKNGYEENESLWKELLNLNNSEALESISKPYFVLQGDTDIVTSTKLVSDFILNSDNKQLHCSIIKNAGHFPNDSVINAIMDKLAHLSDN